MLKHRTFHSTNFYVHKHLYTDFTIDGKELQQYIKSFMPDDLFTINYVYVFFSPNIAESTGNVAHFLYDIVFSECWLNKTSLNHLGICPLSLYRVYSFLSNPLLWQK